MQAVCGQSMRDARKDSYRRLEKLIMNSRVWRAEIVCTGSTQEYDVQQV